MVEGNKPTRKWRFGGNIIPIEPPSLPAGQVEPSGQPVRRSSSSRPTEPPPLPPRQLESSGQPVERSSSQRPVRPAPPPPQAAQASSQKAGHSGQPVAHSSGKKHRAPLPPQTAQASSPKPARPAPPPPQSAQASNQKPVRSAPAPPQAAQASSPKPVRPAPQPPGQQTGQAPAGGQGSLADALRKALDEHKGAKEQSNAKPRSNSFQSHDLDKLAQQIQNVLNETGAKGNKSNAKGSELGYGMDSNAQGSATPPGNAQSVASNKGGNRGRG